MYMKRHHFQNIRADRMRQEGYKDGMCGICKATAEIPKALRRAYSEGHAQGAMRRATA